MLIVTRVFSLCGPCEISIKLVWANINILCPQYWVYKPGVHRIGGELVSVGRWYLCSCCMKVLCSIRLNCPLVMCV